MKSTHIHYTYVWHENVQHRCDVVFTAYPGDPGNTSGPPERCYEATLPELEFISVTVDGIDMLNLLTEEEKTALEERIWNNSEMWSGDQYA